MKKIADKYSLRNSAQVHGISNMAAQYEQKIYIYSLIKKKKLKKKKQPLLHLNDYPHTSWITPILQTIRKVILKLDVGHDHKISILQKTSVVMMINMKYIV